MRKGFIYTVPIPAFSYDKSSQALEFEQLTKEQGAPVILTPQQALIFDMGYKFGAIDKEHDMVMAKLKGDFKNEVICG